MSLLFVLALATAPAPAAPALSGFLDADRLTALCRAEASDPTVGPALCLGYVAGVADDMMLRSRWPFSRRDVCLPRTVTVADLAEAVVRRLSPRHDLKGLAAASAVREVLRREYPCGSSVAAGS